MTYAIDANGKTDTGRVDSCTYTETCHIESHAIGLSISLTFIRPDHASIDLEMEGPTGCCYSSDAAETIHLETKPGLRRVPMYRGRERRRNEFVRNERFGVLYLQFSNLR
ncbi:hypothetical protein [Bradyrhizobium sp. NP1]|uniref:hypothetical protein n=1 Tax=Bradyrhizobium sp. NP1 TaxID=3049772 RepID=UPI0025A67484|nr:hypothetical protein [Bradyrhizobium sp. NP1]WJR76486.1 hypothetical protein QOU61_27535 [Bradyrhizobium sp. NP1]